ncbi:gliding motility-associated C-terminal domain-containing protein [bacterium SCSIO 12643]|nr:gliding motility-associated C-terminal domain-containing protein [bacterium SCSIO 12643]
MKLFYRYFAILSLVFLGFIQNTNASHISGLDFNYQCIGQDSFLVTLNIFRDCSGIPAPNNVTINFTSTCGGNINQLFNKINGPNGTEVSQLCPTSINNSTCNGGTLPGMQQHIYQGIVVLAPPCNTWTMSWSTCNRNTTVNLVGAPCSYISATLNSGVDTCNNSPMFNAQPIPYVCINQVVNYNFAVTEPDGDSIVYSFVNPLSAANTPVNFAAGYTFNQPIPGITLNSTTGQLTFTPTILGNFVIAVQVCEYEYGTGILKACVTRDIQFVVISCSNQQPLAPPGGISNFQGTGLQVGPDSVEVCVGNWFSFDLVFTDPDAADTVSLFSNIATVLPGATVTTTPGNPATISVSWIAQAGSAPFNTFTVTGVDDACPTPGLVTASYNVIVVPSTYAGPDLTICQGTQWAQMGAVGGTVFTWSVLSGSPIDTVPSSPGYNATCQTCQFPSFSPNVTTTYIVTSNLSGTCVNVDTVVVNVAPNFNLTMPNDTLICSVDDYPLQISTDQPSFSYTYKWSPSSSLDYDTVMVPLANPSDPTNYTVTVTSAGGCKKTGSVFIDLSPPFPNNMQVTGDTVLCVGQTTQLGIDYGPIPAGNCGPTTQGCLGVVQNGDIGTGTATNTGNTFPSIYGGSRWGAKHQIIYQPADLISMGLAAGGMLNSIAFFVNTVGTPTVYDNFEIKMGCTSEMDLSNGWISPGNMTVVVPANLYTVVAGWNVHNFNTAYKWDGTSSLVFEICFNNVGNAANGNSIMPYTPTGYQSVIYQSANNQSVCQTYSSVGTFGGATLTNQRPNTRFNFCAGVDPAALTYSWSPAAGLSSTNIPDPIAGPPNSITYQVVVSDTFGGCADTLTHHINMVTQFDAGFTFNDPYCVSADPDSATVNVGGGYFTGTGVDSSGLFDPALAGVGVFPITYHLTTPALCANDSTINVQVIPLPDASITYNEVCVGGAPITLTAATAGGVWSGAAITDTTNGVFDPVGLSAGTYNVAYTLYTPCLSSDTMGIKVIEPYNFTFNQLQVNVCQDDTVHVTNNYTLSNNPLQGAGPVKAIWSDPTGRIDSNGVFDADGATPGDYIVTLSVTGLDGTCGTSKTMTIKVLQKDYPQFPNGLTFCDNEDKATISVSPWLFGNGTSFTQTPISPLGPNDTLDINAFGSNGRFDATNAPLGAWVLEVTYTNLNGCTGVSSDTIRVLETPSAPSPNPAAYCEGEDVYLFATASNPDSLYWYNDINLLDTVGIGNPTFWGVAPNPNSGDVFVWVTENNDRCISPAVKYQLPIKDAPTAEFEMNFTDTTGTSQFNVPHWQSPIYGHAPFSVDFKALNITSTDSVVWYHHWEKHPNSPSGSVNTTNSDNVTFSYNLANLDENGMAIDSAYINQLIVTNEFGCKDTAQALIWSVATEAFFNIFTPNGDGQNDVFYLPVFGLKEYKVEIYNRWGKKVYEWTDPNQGWAGEDQPDGVYYYVLSGIRNDDSEYKKQGTVTLTGSGR